MVVGLVSLGLIIRQGAVHSGLYVPFGSAFIILGMFFWIWRKRRRTDPNPTERRERIAEAGLLAGGVLLLVFGLVS